MDAILITCTNYIATLAAVALISGALNLRPALESASGAGAIEGSGSSGG